MYKKIACNMTVYTSNNNNNGYSPLQKKKKGEAVDAANVETQSAVMKNVE